MIRIDTLTESDKGRKVCMRTYTDICIGKITHWTPEYIYVSFYRQILTYDGSTHPVGIREPVGMPETEVYFLIGHRPLRCKLLRLFTGRQCIKCLSESKEHFWNL